MLFLLSFCSYFKAGSLKDSSRMAGSRALVPLRLRQPLVRTCRLAAAHKKMSTSQAQASSSSASNSAAPPTGQAGEDAKPPLVMQLILDRALINNADWSTGPLMAQAAHAAMAVAAKTAEHPATKEYTSPANLAHMHKVVLRGPEKMGLRELSEKLTAARKEYEERIAKRGAEGADGEEEEEAFPDHYLWIEQPEDIPTVLAIAPNRKPPALKKLLNKCSLLRA